MPTVKGAVVEDLSKSGLRPEEMSVRDIGNPERAATNTPFSVDGYVIPYYSIVGQPIAFYRCKLFTGDDDSAPKYRQPKETANHVYFPKTFYQEALHSPVVFLTEGEKKATLATLRGYPTAAFGGVDSWRNRLISLNVAAEDDDAVKREKGGKVTAKVASGSEVQEDYMSTLAVGLQDLIDFVIQENKTIIIIYDTDGVRGTNFNVQRAAASLGYELRFRGVPFKNIRQIVLPLREGEDKVGLDDYLMKNGNFASMVKYCMDKHGAFPRHPNIRDYLNKRLQKAKMGRKEKQQVSLAIISELDATGMRLVNDAEIQSYYFDIPTHKLLRTKFTGQPNELTESPFGQYMYKKYGLGAADSQVLQWVGSLFTGEEPVAKAQPYRVIARPNTNEDSVYYQISDGMYCMIDASGLKIKNNGDDNILFESGQVEPVDLELLKMHWTKMSERGPDSLDMWWGTVLDTVRLKDKARMRMVIALLFYISPWLYKWRSTQLPIEMTLGEAGSGKSSLQELRLTIQTGLPKMRNAPNDLKDWYSSIGSAGGLHVIDNVGRLDQQLKHRISDEMCRMVTEMKPVVEQRKYFTNSDILRIPINVVFGVTAIQQPFVNADLIQRSIIIELDKTQDMMASGLTYDASWMQQQLDRYGGREAWLAHHFYVLHLFFQEVQKSWRHNYQAKNRLINIEQCMLLMGKVFGAKIDWFPDWMVGETEKIVTETDWAFEGIQRFALMWRHRCMDPRNSHKSKRFMAADITAWAENDDDFKGCEVLINTRKLGRYISAHKGMLASVCKMVEDGMANNRIVYKLL